MEDGAGDRVGVRAGVPWGDTDMGTRDFVDVRVGLAGVFDAFDECEARAARRVCDAVFVRLLAIENEMGSPPTESAMATTSL